MAVGGGNLDTRHNYNLKMKRTRAKADGSREDSRAEGLQRI